MSTCFLSSYGSSLPSIQSLPSSGRASCLTLTYDKSPISRRYHYVGARCLLYPTTFKLPARAADFASCSFTPSARNVSVAAAKDDESYGDGDNNLDEGCSTPNPYSKQGLLDYIRAQSISMETESNPVVDILDESNEYMTTEKEIGLEEYPYGVAEAHASRFTEESGTLGMFKDTIRESGSMLLYLPDAPQGKVALDSQQSEHGNILGHTTFSNSANWHLKTSPPLSFSSFLSSSSLSPILKPLSAAFRAASPAISFTQRARVVTSSATKSPSTIGDTSVLSEEKIYLVFPNEATLANFLAKDGLVKTEIACHPRADILDEASRKMAILEKLTEDGTIKIVIGYHPDMEILDNTSEKEDKVKVMDRLSVKMYEKRQTGERGGRIQETFVPGYYGPLYAIISITGIFMVATTVPLVIALVLVEKHAQILVEKQLCNSQIVKLCAIESGDSLNRLTDAQDARLPVEIKKELAIESGGSSNRLADAPHPVKIMNERANDSGDSLNRFTDAQVSLLPVDNHETKGEMGRVINFTSIKYGLIGHLNQHPMSNVGEPLVSSVAEPLIRATDSVGKWGQVSPVAAVIFAASVILSKILG